MTVPLQRLNLALAALASLAALVSAGCGEDENPESDAGKTVETFFSGIASENFEGACATLVSELVEGLGGASCADGLSAIATGIEPNYEITDVRVSGTKAAVDVELTGESGEVREDTIELVDADGDWLISSFGE